ncbi:MAG TPA: hypothetical protein EYP10_14655 [Armatimonadetes bacterium]|nr:hypothetical protein [Armatimonadota bacterium]
MAKGDGARCSISPVGCPRGDIQRPHGFGAGYNLLYVDGHVKFYFTRSPRGHYGNF